MLWCTGFLLRCGNAAISTMSSFVGRALLVTLMTMVGAFAMSGTALAQCATINSFTAAPIGVTQTFVVQHLNDNSDDFNNPCDLQAAGITALQSDSENGVPENVAVAVPSNQISPSSPSYGTYTVETDQGTNTSDELIKYTPSSNPGVAYTDTLTIYTFDFNNNVTIANTVVVNVPAAPLPAVTSISPTSGPTGTAVTITGTNLASATSVTFGGTAGSVTNNTATSITVTAPTHAAGQVDVLVTTANGTSAVVAGDKFTYVTNPTLTASSTTPSAVEGTAYTTGSPAFSVTPSGGSGTYTSYALNFVSGATVASLGLSFDTTSGKITGTPTATGSAVFTVTVTDSASNTGTTAQVTLTVTAPPVPVVTSFTATAVAYDSTADSITVSGHATNSPTSYAVGSATTANGGTVSVNSSGVATYSAPTGFRGNDSFTFTATNAGGTSVASATVTVPVNNPTITVTPTTLTSGTVGVAYSQSLAGNGGKSPYSFSTSLASGSLPAGLSLSSAGAITGTPTAGGTFTFTVSGTDSSTGTGAAAFTSTTITLTIAAPTIVYAPGSPTSGTVGVAYSQSVAGASGGTGPYTYALTSGSLPAGITLSSAGLLAGTATAGGSFPIKVTVTDSSTGTGPYSTQSGTITLTIAAPTIVYAPGSPTGGTVGVSYSQSVAGASGGTGPYTYALTSGSLPAGITLSSAGLLAGTATAGGSFPIKVTATDSSTGTGPYSTQSGTITLTIAAPTIVYAPGSPTGGTVNVSYSQSVAGASGGTGPYTYALTSGSLPAGVTLSSAGLLAGTTTVAGSFPIKVTATDSSTGTGPYSTQSGTLTLTIAAPTLSISPTTGTPLTGTAETAYSRAFTASGGSGSFSYALTVNSGTMPTGLAFTGGTLAGTPTTSGTVNFTVTATDSVDTGTGSPFTVAGTYTLTVAAPTITVLPGTLGTPVIGTAYTPSLSSSGGAASYTYAVTSGSLPTGVSLSASGAFSGTPTAAGAFAFTVTSTDSQSFTGSQAYSGTIAAPTIALTPSILPGGVSGTAYSQTVTASGGTAPYTYSISAGALPTPLTLNSTTGVISGTPNAVNTYSFTVKATDSTTGVAAPYSGTQAYSITTTPVLPTTGAASATVAYNSTNNPITLNLGGGAAASVAVASAASHGTATASGTSITYTPTSGYSGSDSFTYTATNTTGTSTPGTVTITVTPQTPTAGAVSATVAFNSSANPITLSLGGGTAVSVAVASAASHGTATASGTAIAYTPTTGYAGSDSFTYTATNTGGTSTPATVTITVTPQTPTVSVVSATVAFNSSANPITLSLGGGTAVSVAVASAASHGTATASGTAITYTPTTGYSGTDSFTYTATNTGGTSAPATVTITVNPQAPVAGAASATVAYDSSANAITLNLSGGAPASVAVAGAASHGTATASGTSITYTPTTGYFGSDSFTYTATNATSTASAATVSVTVSAPTIAVTPTTLAGGAVGTPYSQSLTPSGGQAPYTFSTTVASGALPAGLSLGSTGAITGTPTVNGNFSFTVSGTDSSTATHASFTSATISLAISVAAPPTVTSLSVVSGTTAGGTSLTITGTNFFGTPTVSFGGTAATGVTLVNATTVTAVSPAHAAGTIDVTVTASGGTTPANAGDHFTYIAPPTAGGVTQTVTGNTSGNSVTLSLGGGTATSVAVASAASHGTATASGTTISYTPTTGYAGPDSFTYTATNASGTSAPGTIAITVTAPILALSPSSLTAGTVAASYSQSLTASGGTAPYSYSVASGSLPAGITLSSSGALAGTPSAGGSFAVTLKATDATGFSVSKAYTLAINAATVALTPATLPTPQVNAAYSQTLSASGGTAPYQFTVASGQLPPGLTLNATTGVLSGTPTTAASYNATVQATDSSTGNGPYHASITYQLPTTAQVPVAAAVASTTPANIRDAINVGASVTGPITSVAVATNPAHGTAVVSGVNIVYTPTTNYFGQDSFTYTATGPGGTSAPATVTVTVTPLAVPAVQPLTAQVLTNTPVTLNATAGASNGPFTAVAIATPPSTGTAVVSGQNIVYTPAPNQTVTANITFTYTVANVYGVSLPGTATITVNPVPVPPPAQTVVVPPASPTSSSTATASITDNAAGGPFVSASLVTVTPADAGTITLVPVTTQTGSIAPLHIFAEVFGIKPAAAATLTVSGHAFNVVFVPNPAFVGTVTVTYTLANAFAASVQGEVLFVVPPRANVSVDADVVGLVAAQVEEARRFATAQIGNFNQRLEALHGDGPAHSSNGLSVNFGDAATNTASTDPDDNPLTRGTPDVHRLSRNDARNPNDPSTQDPKAHQDGGDDGESILPKDLAFWTAGSVDFGARSSTAQRTGFDFTTDGVSGGADYRLNNQFTVGLGGGYGHDSSDIGTDGTKSIADAYNVAIYGSYHPSSETFIDGVLGYGWLSYDSTRLITTTTDFARGHRNGEQSFGSLTAGYEYKTDTFRLTPYGRFDYSDSTLDQFSEQALGHAALTYFSQSVTTTTATLGFKGDVAVPLDWALFLPFLRVELQHDFQGATHAGLAYADLASAGPAYYVPGDPVDANHMQLGIGANLKVGTFTFGMAFENSFGIHEEQDSQLRLLVTSHF